MATFLGDNSFDNQNIMLVLNHSDNSVTAIYNRSEQFLKKLKILNFWNKNLINISVKSISENCIL